MSTTFDVYPRTAAVPSFGELIELASTRLAERLRRHGIDVRPELRVEVRHYRSHQQVPITPDDEMTWKKGEYGWFYVPEVLGGTDVDYRKVEEMDWAMWRELLETNEQARSERARIESCLATGHYWSFRRSVGQPAIINLAYGIIAASLAELTDGIIYSYDSAWDYDRFPAVAADFYEWYFNPEMTSDPGNADWARTCLLTIASDQRL
ncbi:hypothetical protein [uncultured Variovorax sp.]|uniref:hypothetical protein n=1 Tax=uncultured Variovorax sp. TaxID=114708 RepID=UPI0025F5A631|nr:hypothetical protein [uncultured Variovorax sp.]